MNWLGVKQVYIDTHHNFKNYPKKLKWAKTVVSGSLQPESLNPFLAWCLAMYGEFISTGKVFIFSGVR